MIVLKGGPVAHFDVDDTLILFDRPEIYQEQEGLRVINLFDRTNTLRSYLVNSEMVSLLIEHANRGHVIVVWSQGGVDWAERAVRGLGIEDYVNVVQEKPRWLYDDLPADKFLPKTRWIGNKEWLNKRVFITNE